MSVKKRAKPKIKQSKNVTKPSVVLSPARGLKLGQDGKVRIALEPAFSVLRQQQDSFSGHKEILLAGICGWLRRSRTQVSARKSMAKATARYIAAAEEKEQLLLMHASSACLKAKPTTRDIIIRSAMAQARAFGNRDNTGVYFQIYFFIGGMKAVIDAYKAPAKTKKKRAIPRRDSGIRQLVAMAAIMDFHSRNFSNDPTINKKPNLSDAGRLIGILVKKPKGSKRQQQNSLGTSQAYALRAEHGKAFALLYGADRTVVEGGVTLLDRLLSKKCTIEEFLPHVGTWLAYAKYFRESVLSKTDGKWESTFSAVDPAVELQQPPLPAFSDEDIKQMREVFSTKKASEAREQYKRN